MNNQILLKSKNPLLLKDQDGIAKPSTFDLPDQKHTYGKKVLDDPQPIKYVVNGWETSHQSGGKISNQKNFKELNKKAIENKVHTAKGQKQLRATMDIVIKPKQGKKVMPIMLPEEDFIYGVANRPSTPVKLVIGNCYAIEEANRKEEQYKRQTQKAMTSKDKKLHPFKTKSQFLKEQKLQKEKNYRGKPNVQEKFKMDKFTKTSNTKVDTNLKSFQGLDKSQKKEEIIQSPPAQ